MATATVILVASTAIALRDRGYGLAKVVVYTDAARPTPVTPDAVPEPVAALPDPALLRQDPRVAHVPERALVEPSGFGLLPIRASDGRRPLDVYSRPWSGTRGARIAIVLDSLGLSQTSTLRAIERLPGEVTFAFSPQGNSIGRWMVAARNSGHELLMQLPLEPVGYPHPDPGRYTLMVNAGSEQTRQGLLRILGRTTNYVGLVNHMGSRFLGDRTALTPVLEEIGRRGLLYLDDGTSAHSLAGEIAGEIGVPLAEGDGVFDREQSRDAILQRLDELERLARARGTALGTGSVHDLTVDTLVEWLGEVRQRGVEIVPVSALAHDPERP